MKRNVATIKQYDYTSKEGFEKDVKIMRDKGYKLIDNETFRGALINGELDDEKWKYTAYFIKSEWF